MRLLAGRLAGFEYSPNIARADERSLDRALEWVELTRAHRQASPRHLAGSALIRLMEHKDEAGLQIMKEAVALAPDDAALRSDLAAMYLDRGKRRKDPNDLLLSLAEADRAVRLSPFLPEARFNFALALDHLHLRRGAHLAWSQYLGIDPDSGWTTEAERHLEALSKVTLSSAWKAERDTLEAAAFGGDMEVVTGTVRRFPQQAREYAEVELLGRWAETWGSGRITEANRSLKMAGMIGSALGELNDDHLLADTIVGIERSTPRRLASIASGVMAYREGISLLDRELVSEASRRFQEASSYLLDGGSPFQIRARVEKGFCLVYLGDARQALAVSESLRSTLAGKKYRSVRGRVQWLSGLAYIKLSDPSASDLSYQAALAELDGLKELDNTAALYTLLAENLRLQGDVAGSWEHRLKALEIAGEIGPSIRLHNALFDAAEAALNQNRPEVAVLFQNEMVYVATALQNPLLVSEALVRRSKALVRLGDPSRAMRDLDATERWIRKIEDESWRRFSEADTEIARGELLAETAPMEAVRHLSRAIDFYTRGTSRFRIPAIYKQRAKIFLSLGQIGQAEDDLRAALVEYERIRKSIAREPLRISYIEQAGEIVDTLIEVESFRQSRPKAAFETVESFRARSLLEGFEPSISSVVASLPEDLAVIEYAVLPNRLVAWIVTRHGIQSVPIDISARELRQVAVGFLQELSRPSPLRPLGRSQDLFRVLIEPLASWIRPFRTLVIVPDKMLHDVPFAALFDQRSGRYLIEDKVLVYASSATAFVRALEKKAGFRGASENLALVVGNPSFDEQRFRQLRPLRAAEGEARHIAGLYPRRTLLLGEEATEQRVVAGLSAARTVHLAVHALKNNQFPSLSSLLFAASPRNKGGDGILYAHEVRNLPISKAELVVLAGCQTASGSVTMSEGSLSLAHTFLAAGAATVLASLWDAEDVGMAGMLFEFHHEIRRGSGPATALQRTQIQAIHSEDPEIRRPRSWAGLKLFGAP